MSPSGFAGHLPNTMFNMPMIRMLGPKTGAWLPFLMVLLWCGGMTPAMGQSWELIWNDEFDYTGTPDPSKWGYDLGAGGWGNQEAQHYTNRPENARVEDGHLVIEARREDYEGSPYTSARLVSRGKGDFTYGRVEVRASLPAGRGTWPAIWMLPTEWIYGDGGWPDNGEIDILEHVGYEPNEIHANVHTHDFNHQLGNNRGATRYVDDVEGTFHVYALEWTPRELRFFYNDDHYFTYENTGAGWTAWPFDHPFHLILNIAVGGTWGGAQGIDPTVFPQQMRIDYVRVYEDATPPPSVALASPAPGASVTPGSPLNISATVGTDGRAVERVAFYQGDGLLGEVAAAPYALTVPAAAEGCYRLTAHVTDAEGYTAQADTVDVTVGATCGRAPYLIAPAAVPGRVEAEHYDLGGPGEAYFDLDAENQGGALRASEGVDLVTIADAGPGVAIGSVTRREWVEYTVDVAATGTYLVEARLAAPTNGGDIQVLVDGETVGTITYVATGGSETWRVARLRDVPLTAGRRTVRLRFQDGGLSLNWIRFELTTTTSRDRPDEVPGAFLLHPVYPNPFNPAATLTYTLADALPLTLNVYDARGRHVMRLAEGLQPAGRHTVRFGAQGLPSGTYFVELTTPHGSQVQALTLAK